MFRLWYNTITTLLQWLEISGIFPKNRRSLHGFTWKQVHIEIISLILNLVQFTTLQLLKITCPAHEQDDEQRARFQANIGENYSPETLVFLDESACNRITGWQSKGWAPIGKRAQKHDYFVRGQRYFCHLHFLLIIVHWLAKLRYSILPAISLDGVLHLELSCNPGLLMSFVHSLTYCWTKWTLICKRTPSLFSIMWLHAILMTCMRLLKVKVCVFTTFHHTPQTSILLGQLRTAGLNLAGDPKLDIFTE